VVIILGEKLPLEGAAEEEAENVERWELLQKVKGLDVRNK